MLFSTSKLFSKPLKQIGGPSTCRQLTHANDINLVHNLEHNRGISTLDRASATSKHNSVKHDAPVSSVGAYFDQFHNYCHMIEHAKALAKRSILIDHCGLNYIDFTSEFQNVERVYAINKEARGGGGGVSKLSLVEFKTENDAEEMSKKARHNLGFLPIPLKILRYQSTSSPTSYDKQSLPFPIHKTSLFHTRELSTNFKSYTELVANNTMTLVDFKMRLITLVNFERVLCAGLFQEYELMPFGSSVIDIGRNFGDLDIVLTRKENHFEFINEFLSGTSAGSRRKMANNSNPNTTTKDQPSLSNLVHLDKSLFSETRDNSGIRGAMKWFDYVLKEYMPLTEGYNVLFLRHAKVPIIKFTSLVTSLDCDLSFNFALDHRQNDVLATNYSGIIMSQLLYSICRNNNLFTGVIVYLRIFAKLTNITTKEPNVGWTNFQFLSLVLFYLQTISITKIKTSTQSTSKDGSKNYSNDLYEYKIQSKTTMKQTSLVLPFKYLLDGRRMSKFPPIVYNFTDEQLNDLIPQVVLGFFEFYSNYDFSQHALNLFEAQIEMKLDNSSVYVTNPLDRTRNICHNVNRRGVDNLMQQVRLAAEVASSGQAGPLSLIKSLMARHIKNRANVFREGVYDFRQEKNVDTHEIAQDVFR